MNFDALLNHKPGERRALTSTANETVKALRALTQKKYRQASGLFCAEGARTLIEALDHGHRPLCIAYLAGARGEVALQWLMNAAREAGALQLEMTAGVLEKISARDNPQTVLGVFRQVYKPLESLPADDPCLVVEDVRDAGNVGTMLRTADGFGIKHIVLVGHTTDPYSLECVRASMGSIFGVGLYRATLADFAEQVAAGARRVIGMALQDAVPLCPALFAPPYALVMGNEQQGLSPAMRGLCQHLVKIPMRGGADSFNVAVAAGIALYATQLR